MGLRQHKKAIQIGSAIMIGIFAISMLVTGILFLKNNVFGEAGGNREVIATVNGTKIYRDDFERESLGLKNQLSDLNQQKMQQLSQAGIPTENLKNVPDNIINEYVLQLMIHKEILLSSAKNLGIKISGATVEQDFNSYQKQSKLGKQEFAQYLRSVGYNVTSFKKMIKDQKTIEKMREKLFANDKITDEEIKKAYERNKYTQAFLNQDFEDVKEQIKENMTQDKDIMILNSYLAKAKEKAKIVFKNKDFEKMYANMTTTVAQNGEYKYTNESLNEQIINTVSQTQQGYSDKLVNDLKATLKVNLDKFVKIANKAKAAGIKADPDLVGVDQLRDYSQKYYNHLIDTYKPDDAALQAKFNAKKDSYNIPNSIGGYVIGEEYQAGENDFQAAKKQAEDIMKTTTKDNFAAKAKEFSKDPGSANNGGSLGETADLSQLVPEFANAVKKSKAGDIVGPIKTQFGYHIIYIQSKDAKNENVAKVSHILITPTISEASKQEVIKKVQALKAEIESKKTTFENVEKQDKYKFSIKERFKKMVKSDAIPGIGKNDELMNQIFALQINGILDRNDATGYYLITKTSEIPFTQATFENSKERVRLELAHEYADKQLEIM
ncbi:MULTISPECIES: peptidylprolyl isomerase [Leptotrichia]|jgi:putative chaperone surA|uniref:peptidylprolyl isomerase n=1 Tax=Leptotrichia TaxID=32067 RepID=UPI0003ADB2CC|nr:MULTISPECIES: peptidylprolyl isomerase [Leptotrichia]ERL25925.1 PPIC-type PPIASE domain protein [Leptotrichia sp. oral taxon 225 str. F0581]WLD74316.1 peptidylprolyl isomerase [Leptotrichia sp. HMT-225]